MRENGRQRNPLAQVLLPLTYYCTFYFLENYIDGKEFARLTESEVKDMVPRIGLAKKIMRLIPKVR